MLACKCVRGFVHRGKSSPICRETKEDSRESSSITREQEQAYTEFYSYLPTYDFLTRTHTQTHTQVEVVKKTEDADTLLSLRLSLSPLFSFLSLTETEFNRNSISPFFRSSEIAHINTLSHSLSLSPSTPSHPSLTHPRVCGSDEMTVRTVNCMNEKSHLYFFDSDGAASGPQVCVCVFLS